jgi:hypothetical protein
MNQNTEIDLLQILSDTVEDYFNIPRGQIKVKTRKKEIKEPRQIAMFFAMDILYPKNGKLYSETNIGKYFFKDHATVIHAKKTINNLINTDKQLREDVDEIRKKIKENLNGTNDKLTLKKLFMFGMGIYLNGYAKRLDFSFSFDVCCAVALQNKFELSQIANYTSCEKAFIESRITYAYVPKIKEMNELLIKYFKS